MNSWLRFSTIARATPDEQRSNGHTYSRRGAFRDPAFDIALLELMQHRRRRRIFAILARPSLCCRSPTFSQSTLIRNSILYVLSDISLPKLLTQPVIFIRCQINRSEHEGVEQRNRHTTSPALLFVKQVYRLIFLFALAIRLGVVHGLRCPSRESIAQISKKVNVPGAAIIVVNATHTLYEQAVGYGVYIAIAVMQRVEAELVDLDANVDQ